MNNALNMLPMALLYSRLVIGFVILALSLLLGDAYKLSASLLMTIGLLTDIFDGIIARHLNISTQSFRRLDSTIDQVFFISVVVATFIRSPDFFFHNALKLGILCGFEALTYLVCFAKFKKEIATHSIGAKIWTLLLFATLVQITLSGRSVLIFEFCFWIGVLTRIEIIAIILTLKEWTHDIPTFYHALNIRRGKQIKRSKLFNG